MTTTWLGVWTRAVIGPAYRRTAAVWAGTAVIAAVIFGPTGMQPRDLTGLVLHEPGAALVVGVTWLLVFAPIARGIVHAEGARFLRSLPAPRAWPVLLALAAIIAFQLPWLILWLAGEGVAGLGPFAASTLAVIALAWWRPVRGARGMPGWRSALAAMRGVYLAALARRAGDALVRGAGLAIFAGLAGGLFVRNNQLDGAHAATIAASVIAIVVVPAQAGILGVVLDAHVRSTWLAESLGIAGATRTLALVATLAITHVAAAVLATIGCAIVVGPSAATLGWIALTCIACAFGSALGTTRVILGAVGSRTAATRMAVGALAIGTANVGALGLFGAVPGIAAILVGMLFALTTRRHA